MARPRRQLTEAEIETCKRLGAVDAMRQFRVSHTVLLRHLEAARVDRKTWTDQRDRTLRENHGRVKNKDLVALTGMTISQIKRRIRALGLALPRRWSGTDAWMRENAARLGVQGIMKKIGMRSEGAVRTRLWRLGVCPGEDRQDMSISLVCDFLNVNETTIYRWAKRSPGLSIVKGRIRPRDLREFILDNPLVLDPRRIPGESWPTLVQLLGKRW